jgi:uncharacterized protein YdeI (YjbR/CyaY-like superfamily)
MAPDLPDDLIAAVRAEPDLLEALCYMPPAQRHEYVRYIADAARAETRAQRIARAIDLLRLYAASRPVTRRGRWGPSPLL